MMITPRRGLAAPVLQQKFRLGECPVWDERRNILYWSDIDAGEVWSLRYGETEPELAYTGAPVGGILLSDDGLLLFRVHDVVHLEHVVAKRPPALIAALPDGSAERFNDALALPDGSVVAGTIDQDTRNARVYHFTFRGAPEALLGPTAISNGLALSPDARTLYWSDTTAGSITSYPVSDGRIVADRPHTVHRAGTGDGLPDGLAVDASGRLWSARYGAGKVYCLSPEGDLVAEIAVPTPEVTSLAFGGPGNDTLYITAKHAPVFAVDTNTTGLPQHRARIPGAELAIAKVTPEGFEPSSPG